MRGDFGMKPFDGLSARIGHLMGAQRGFFHCRATLAPGSVEITIFHRLILSKAINSRVMGTSKHKLLCSPGG